MNQFLTDAEHVGFCLVENKEFFEKVFKYRASLFRIKSILLGNFFRSTFSLFVELSKIDRCSYKIYVPIKYTYALKVYIFRWFPLYRKIKNRISCFLGGVNVG